MKTVFVVLRVFFDEETVVTPRGVEGRNEIFDCVRRSREKGLSVAAEVKPAVVLEVPTTDGKVILNRWELS